MLNNFVKQVINKANEALERDDYEYITTAADELTDLIKETTASIHTVKDAEAKSEDIKQMSNLKSRLLRMLNM